MVLNNIGDEMSTSASEKTVQIHGVELAKPLTGGRVFLYMCLFFGVIFAVNTAFVTVAIKSNTGVVDNQYYERGVNYNETLAQSEWQKSLGWVGILDQTNERIRFKLTDNMGQPVTQKTVTIVMRRPVQAGQDFDVPLKEQSPGIYVGSLKNTPLGIWNAYIHAEWKQGDSLREYDQMEKVQISN